MNIPTIMAMCDRLMGRRGSFVYTREYAVRRFAEAGILVALLLSAASTMQAQDRIQREEVSLSVRPASEQPAASVHTQRQEFAAHETRSLYTGGQQHEQLRKRFADEPDSCRRDSTVSAKGNRLMLFDHTDRLIRIPVKQSPDSAAKPPEETESAAAR